MVDRIKLGGTLGASRTLEPRKRLNGSFGRAAGLPVATPQEAATAPKAVMHDADDPVGDSVKRTERPDVRLDRFHLSAQGRQGGAPGCW